MWGLAEIFTTNQLGLSHKTHKHPAESQICSRWEHMPQGWGFPFQILLEQDTALEWERRLWVCVGCAALNAAQRRWRKWCTVPFLVVLSGSPMQSSKDLKKLSLEASFGKSLLLALCICHPPPLHLILGNIQGESSLTRSTYSNFTKWLVYSAGVETDMSTSLI